MRAPSSRKAPSFVAGDKPNSVTSAVARGLWMIISLSPARAGRSARAECDYYPEAAGLAPGGSGGPRSLFCLAPHGVCRAPSLARRAVGSYPAFSPLRNGRWEIGDWSSPAALQRPDLLSPICHLPNRGMFSVTLSVAPGFRPACPRFLRGMLPDGVRTFLCRALARPAAIICQPRRVSDAALRVAREFLAARFAGGIS